MQSKAIEVIRHSLAAASAALSLLETDTPLRQEAVVEEAAPLPEVQNVVEEAAPLPEVQNVVEEAAPLPEVATTFSDLEHQRLTALMNELNGKYALRTVAELEDKLGIDFTTMTQMLDDEGVSFVTRTRRSDSAMLIGLDSRN